MYYLLSSNECGDSVVVVFIVQLISSLCWLVGFFLCGAGLICSLVQWQMYGWTKDTEREKFLS